MSSCFLCDCSYKFLERDEHDILVPKGDGGSTVVVKNMKQLPIMIGSSGIETDDQQHDNSKKQNYFPYKVEKIEFCGSFMGGVDYVGSSDFPDYVLIFKVPFREPIFDYYFYLLESFMLYSEPESVLGYKVLPAEFYMNRLSRSGMIKIVINKPFIVGPNEYLGVFYMGSTRVRQVDASAKVWFDTA